MADDKIVDRILSRYAAAVLDEKMTALLMKLRKGADTTLALSGLFKVLGLLGGWRVEEIVGLIPVHYDDHDHRLSVEDNEAAARASYDRIKSFEVASLPASPKLGHPYVMDLKPFQSKPYNYNKSSIEHGAAYKLWIGAPGYRVTDPQGKIFEVLPARHDITRGASIRDMEQGLPAIDIKSLKKSLRTYDVLPWLKKDTSYLDQINELLGLESHEKAAPRTRDNTGTCAVCFRNIKLVQKSGPPTMALHGYNRPGHGYVVGKCWGGAHHPYELSCDATKIILKYAEEVVTTRKKYLQSLSSPNLTEFNKHHWWGSSPQMLKKDEADKLTLTYWTHMLKDHVEETERHVRKAERERDIYKWLIDNWKVRDLPKENDKQIDWFLIAAESHHAPVTTA